MNKQVMSLFGLMQRAGKLVSGESNVLECIRKGQAYIVCLTTDVGPNTYKKITDKCNYYHVPYVQLMDSMTMSNAIGKPRRVVAISDKGFANKLQQLIEEGD